MLFSPSKPLAVVLAGLLFAAASSPADAQITYHFAETRGDGNVSSGLVGSGAPGSPRIYNPFTFDFTLANALAASTSYNFGVAGVEPGSSGNVLDLRVSDGTPLTTFTLADYNGRYEVFGGYNPHSLSRINLQTDAAGAISYFSIYVEGRSPINSQTILFFGLVGTPAAPSIQEALYYDPALGYRTTVAGDVVCSIYCGGTITSSPGGIAANGANAGGGSAGAVPEPASWAMTIAGFGLVGGKMRRRRMSVRFA